jgi:hypothetical protein
MGVFSGWQLAVYWRTGSGTFSLLDGIQRISYTLVNDIDAKDECGSRYPTYLVEGIYGTTGTAERFYTGSGTWATFQNGQSALTTVDLQIYPNLSGSGKAFIQLGGVKMNKIAVNHRPGSNLMIETWDFIGTGSVTLGTAS